MRNTDRVIYTLGKDDIGADAENYQVVIDCKSVNSERSLFSAFKTALSFPSYFGWNWNALNDCLGDLDWIPSKKIYVIFEHFDYVIGARRLNEKIALLLQIMVDACNYLACERQAFGNQKVLVFDFDVNQENTLVIERLFDEQHIEPKKRILRDAFSECSKTD